MAELSRDVVDEEEYFYKPTQPGVEIRVVPPEIDLLVHPIEGVKHSIAANTQDKSTYEQGKGLQCFFTDRMCSQRGEANQEWIIMKTSLIRTEIYNIPYVLTPRS